MADITPILIKDLGSQSTLSDDDYFIVGGADAKKITVAQMKTALGIYNVVSGSVKNATFLATIQTIGFSNGTGTINLSTIASAYGKNVANVIAQLRSASSAVITSANVDANVATIKCSNLTGTGFTGEISATLYLLLV